MKISNIPVEERPREKALRYGIDAISNKELLAIIIGSGVKNKSALDIAGSLLDNYHSLSSLSEASLASLKSEFGLNQIMALKLLATFHFYKRLQDEKRNTISLIKSTDDLYHLYSFIEDENNEMFIVVTLNQQGRILKEKRLYVGTEEFIKLNIRELFCVLLENKASMFALIHNHPCGGDKPSDEDIETTLIIKEYAAMFNLVFFDHLIIYKGGYYSFKNNNIDKITNLTSYEEI